MSKRRAVLLALLVLLVVGAIFIPKAVRLARDDVQRESFRKLVRYVADKGQVETTPSRVFQLFKLPTEGDEVVLKTLTSSPEKGLADNGIKTIAVRERDGGPDVLLIAAYPDRSLFFLVGDDGELLKATMIDEQARRIPNAETRFGEEKMFWLKWAETIAMKQQGVQ